VEFPQRDKASKSMVSIKGIDSPMLDYLEELNQKGQPIEEVKIPTKAEE